MQGRTFKGKVLLAVLVVLAHVSNGEHLGNASCANDDNQALLQARVKTACSPDVTPPVPGVPADIEVVNAPDECFAVVTYTSPTATDDCDPSPFIEQSGGLGSGSEFPVGSTTETFTATDATGNFESGSFHVEVMDDQDPDMTPVPADIIVNTAPGQCTAVVTFATPTATDNCPGAMIDLTAGKESGSTFDLGVTAQTFTATDASGNSLSDIFHVVVKDNENPGITGLPSSSTHGNDAGQCGAVVNYAAPTATDNCPPATIARTSGPSSGDLFPAGATPVTFTATDSSSNTFSDTFTVQVNDDEPPVPSVPANIVVNNDAGLCGADVSYATPTATDNCAVATVVRTSGSGPGSFSVGPATTETWTATDVFGNTASSSFTVQVNDVEAPVPSVPANIVVNNAPGVCEAVVTYTAPTVTDNCGATIALTGGPSSGSSVPVGSTDVTFTATDAAGNTGSGTFTVTVQDTEAPALEVEDIDVESCSPTTVTFSPTASDNCPGVQVSCTPSSGSEFPVGETQVICTAADGAGGQTQDTFNVLVECVASDPPPDGTTQAPTYYRKHRGNTVQRVQSHFRDIRKNMKNIRKKVRHHIKKWLGD